MHFLTRLLLLFLLMGLPAVAETAPVRIAIPLGVWTRNVATEPAGRPDAEYVTLESVRIVNPSIRNAQAYDPKEFHLVIGERVYVPTPRPGPASVDLSLPGTLAPGQATAFTLSFLVPAGTSDARFEFMPNWVDDAGDTVDWCCYYGDIGAATPSDHPR